VRLDRLDRWLGPCLVLLAVVWLWLSYTHIPGAHGDDEPGPRAFPLLLGAILAVLGTVMSVSAFVAVRHRSGEEIPSATRREALVAAGTFGLLLLYAFLLEKAGFLVATPVVVALAMRGILRGQSWMLTLLLAGGLTLGCWIAFVVLLEAPLPRGTWWMWLL
jgi:putative tricarboxylic transport membrane protein